jgi:hypothetical protein
VKWPIFLANVLFSIKTRYDDSFCVTTISGVLTLARARGLKTAKIDSISFAQHPLCVISRQNMKLTLAIPS